MLEKLLQDGEIIELQENCNYCRDGAMALVNKGNVALTNKRLIVCKDASAGVDGLQNGLIAGLAVGFIICVRIFYQQDLGILRGIIFGLVFCGIIGGIGALYIRSKKKTIAEKTVTAEITITKESIESVEDGSRGVNKMLVIKTHSGDICKINVQDKERWRSALLKQ